jgi:hypothetical protein
MVETELLQALLADSEALETANKARDAARLAAREWQNEAFKCAREKQRLTDDLQTAQVEVERLRAALVAEKEHHEKQSTRGMYHLERAGIISRVLEGKE